MRFSSALRFVLMAALALLFIIFQPQVAQSISPPLRWESKPQVLGKGNARSYIERDAKRNVKEMGVILTDAALTDLPHQGHYELVLPLPKRGNPTAFNHIGLNWNHHGHEPPGIYDVPHFDFHFYTLKLRERDKITAIAEDLKKVYKTPDPTLVAPGYVLAPDSAIARMGDHWVDPSSEELQGTPHGFSRTFIYGYYNGKTAFAEPMVSLEFLKRQQSFESAIPVPKRYSQPGSYPTGYRITYNKATGEHTVALTGLTQSQRS